MIASQVLLRGVVAITLLASGSQAASGQDQPPSQAVTDTTAERHVGLHDILDAKLPIEGRRAAFAQLDKDAIGGSRFAQYAVGSLYRVGDLLPDALVARDNDKARRYLSTAAAHGNLHAMAKMAEIELEDKHLLEAMIWAQIYGHYALESKPDQINTGKPAGYYGDLLHRLYAHLDEKQMPDVIQHVNAFIAAHDADIRDGMSSSETAYESGNTHKKTENLNFLPMVALLPQHHRDCYAEYVIEFASDGSAKQAWILDALPDIKVGKDLRAAAMRVRVNAVDAASTPRFALVPLDFSFGQYSLHKNH